MQRFTQSVNKTDWFFLAKSLNVEMLMPDVTILKWEIKQTSIQGWQYGKGLIYLRPIFWLTKLAFLRARTTLKKCSSGPEERARYAEWFWRNYL